MCWKLFMITTSLTWDLVTLVLKIKAETTHQSSWGYYLTLPNNTKRRTTKFMDLSKMVVKSKTINNYDKTYHSSMVINIQFVLFSWWPSRLNFKAKMKNLGTTWHWLLGILTTTNPSGTQEGSSSTCGSSLFIMDDMNWSKDLNEA